RAPRVTAQGCNGTPPWLHRRRDARLAAGGRSNPPRPGERVPVRHDGAHAWCRQWRLVFQYGLLDPLLPVPGKETGSARSRPNQRPPRPRGVGDAPQRFVCAVSVQARSPPIAGRADAGCHHGTVRRAELGLTAMGPTLLVQIEPDGDQLWQVVWW